MLRRALLLLSLCLLPAGVAAEPMVLAPVRDNTLFEDAEGDTSNGAGPAVFCGRNSQGRARRAVLAFDLGAAPPAAMIDSVRLEMHVGSSSDLEPRELALHVLAGDWGEAGSSSSGGGGAPAQPGDATWQHRFYPAALWTTPGGDFAAASSAVATVLGEGDVAWTSAALTAAVRDVVSAGTGELGLLVRGDESVSNTARRLDSRESPTLSFRPRLILFLGGADPTVPISWGRLKSRFR